MVYFGAARRRFMVPLSGHGRRPGPAGARPPPSAGAWRAVGAARPRRRGRGARRGVWLRVGHATVPKGYAAGYTEFLCSAPSCDGRCLHRPCSCTLLRSHPAACDARPRALYRPWRTQHRSHDKRLSVRRPAPSHRRRGRDCRHALPSPHVVARRRRRPVAGSSCRLRLLTRQRSWRRRGSAGGGVSAVDALHERAQHAAPAGTAAGRSVEGRPRMHECYTRECGVNAASRPAPRGARARCPRRAVSARLRVVCERTVLSLPHGGLLSCCERRHSLLSPVPPPGNMRTASQA